MVITSVRITDDLWSSQCIIIIMQTYTHTYILFMDHIPVSQLLSNEERKNKCTLQLNRTHIAKGNSSGPAFISILRVTGILTRL